MPQHGKPSHLRAVACVLGSALALAFCATAPAVLSPHAARAPSPEARVAAPWQSEPPAEQPPATGAAAPVAPEAADRLASARGGNRAVDGEETVAPPAATATARPTPGVEPTPGASGDSGKGLEIAALAARYVGLPYRWGGASPATGFDCSGFTWYVYKQAGIAIPNHDLKGQLGAGARIAKGDLQPGDLVFFQNTYKAGLSHAGVYVGEGVFVHAVDEHTSVAYGRLDSPYWRPRFFAGSRPR